MSELKAKHQASYVDRESFKNKIKYYSVMDELNDEITKSRVKPSNIKNRRLYPNTYFLLRFFGF
jgi:predicted DNA-binding helix-hairpin-helix protein